jgi:hypothetical protein
MADVVATGVINAVGEEVSVAMSGNANAGVHIDFTSFTGGLVAFVSFNDGTAWQETSFYRLDGGTFPSLSGGADHGYGIVVIPGVTHVKVRALSLSSGSATVTIRSTNTAHPGVALATGKGASTPGSRSALIVGGMTAPPPNPGLQLPLLVSPDGSATVRARAGTGTTYSASRGGRTEGITTAAAAQSSLAYLLHPNAAASTLVYRLKRVLLSWAGGAGGAYTLNGDFITAENATPGGTLITPQPHSPKNPASSAIYRSAATGAPTRSGGSPIFSLSLSGGATGSYEWLARPDDQPILLHQAQTAMEGFEVYALVNEALSSSPRFGVVFEWEEGKALGDTVGN